MKHEGFTPGPWEVDGDSVQGELHIRPAGTGWLLAVVYLDGITAEYQNVTANAHLIADAPRLYAENQRLREALAGLVAVLDAIDPYQRDMCVFAAIHGNPYDGPNWVDEMVVARAALTEPDA